MTTTSPSETYPVPIEPLEPIAPAPGPDYAELMIPVYGNEETTAFAGIKRSIAELRASRAREQYEETAASDVVIRSAPGGANQVRGFRTSPESGDVKATNIIEKTTRQVRQFQSRKIRTLEQEIRDRSDLHDKPVTTLEGYILEKIRIDESGMTPKQKRAALKNIARIEKLNAKVQKIKGQMQDGEDGNTPHGRMRQRKIQRSQEAYKRHSYRVDELDKEIVPAARKKAREIIRQNPGDARKVGEAERIILEAQHRLGELWTDAYVQEGKDERKARKIQSSYGALRARQKHRELFETKEGRDKIKEQHGGKLAEEK